MTWPDILLIVSLLVFLAMGAKLGSLWTGACLIGGFLGAFLVDYYALPLASMMGNFAGASKVAAVLLFLGGVVAALVPGWLMSRLFGLFFLGIIDGIMGLVTGGFAWFIAVTLLFLVALPNFSKIERSSAWRKSSLVKPMHHFVEDFFNDSHFKPLSPTASVTSDIIRDVKPVVKSAGESIKDAGENLVEKIKKK